MTQTYLSEGLEINVTCKHQNYFINIILDSQDATEMVYALLINIDNERSIHNKKNVHFEFITLPNDGGNLLLHFNLLAEKAKKIIKMCNFNNLEGLED